MTRPKFSVVIPTYNTGKYLKECLDSVLNQPLKEIEVICVDAESTDNTALILNEYAKNDNRIKVIYMKNEGVGSARNVAIEQITGKYTFFLDSDDWIEPNALKMMYDKMEKDQSEILFFNVYFVEETGEKKEKMVAGSYYRMFKEEPFSPVEAKEIIYNTQTRPFRAYLTDSLKKYNYKYSQRHYREDHVPFFTLIANVDRMSVLNEFVVNYRLSEGQATQNQERCINYHYIEFKEVLEALQNTKNGNLFFNKCINLKLAIQFGYLGKIRPYARKKFYNMMKKTFKFISENYGDEVVLESSYYDRYKLIKSLPYELYKPVYKCQKTIRIFKATI